jgi:hypothetical protein
MTSLMLTPAPCSYDAAGGYACARGEPFAAGDGPTPTNAVGDTSGWQPATSATLTLSSKGKPVKTLEVDLPYRQPRSKTACAIPKWGTMDIQARCPKCAASTAPPRDCPRCPTVVCGVRLGWPGRFDGSANPIDLPVVTNDSGSVAWNVCRGVVPGVGGVHFGLTRRGTGVCTVVTGAGMTKTAHDIRDFETYKYSLRSEVVFLPDVPADLPHTRPQ